MMDTPSPDLHTGTGNFTVPIALPPGRNDFQPQLNLVYSTGNGNGAFGLGWGLSIPGISRQTSKGIPHYQDHHLRSKERDTFILLSAVVCISLSFIPTWQVLTQHALPIFSHDIRDGILRIATVAEGICDHW